MSGLVFPESAATKRILVSFSGGRTSAYMAQSLKQQFGQDPTVDLVFVMANSTQEDARTIEFARRCDQAFDLGLVLIEAVVSEQQGVSTTFRVVDFGEADLSGVAFKAMIAKYGLPNKNYPHCNRELKLRPIHAYARSIGWEPGTYETAIGIRADEIDRISAAAAKERLIYPMVRWGVTKADVLRFWRQQPFDLELPEHLGNCTWCWKKSLRKHLTLAVDHPHVFAFPAAMEAQYQFHGSNKDGQPRRLFRQRWTALDIMARAQLPFERFVESEPKDDPELDQASGCSESCDVFAHQPPSGDLFENAA